MKKSTPKTTVSKKAVPKKTPKSGPLKTQGKKTAAKKSVAAKKLPQPKQTTPVKAKTPKTQKPTTRKAASAKSSKEDLQKVIANLETRMKRADTLTRKSVKALESAVMTLDARTRKDNSTGKAALTRRVNQLSAKLTEMVERTQAQVHTELKTVLNNPSVENLQAALLRADQRLTEAEHSQAQAISKVNRHLASIATAVDARIEEEARARKSAIAALDAKTEKSQNVLTTRIDVIESDTASALAGVGDKIAQLSDELTHRGEASELSIREKISEIALQTQTEFEAYRAGLERRLDDVAQNETHYETQRLEQSIASLSARLEGLEYAVANAPQFAATSEAVYEEPHQEIAAPALSLVASSDSAQVASQEAYTPEPHMPDAFSPLPQSVNTPVAEMPNPYLSGQMETAAIATADASGPVEFNPNNYTAAPQAPLPPPPVIAPLQSSPAQPLRDFTQPELLSNTPPSPNDQAIPYADPAYAEADPTMDRVRIGGDVKSKLKLPKLSGRNLRVAAVAAGVTVIGLVAAKGLLGEPGSPVLPQQAVKTAQNARVQSAGQETNSAPLSIPKPDVSAAPIGDYADNRAVEVAPSSEAAKTLNSAAAAGDPVAQFQLGLSYLEQGRTDEGVSLIRKSANQNQPAAQYRLAKLYEIGEGVSQDSEMARQLTERAARNGNRIAMHDLALYYAEGRGGVEADLPTAANWFEKAAERGVVDSQFNLGVLFESGQGLPKNMSDAFVWYSIAAAQGDQFAKTRVEVLKGTLEQTDLVSASARISKFKPVKIDDAANGIFRNVAWAKPKNAAGEKVSQVKQVQTMLTELGYEIGGADGSVGPKTRAAIMSFERANSLPETGRVNAALVDRLELATGA